MLGFKILNKATKLRNNINKKLFSEIHGNIVKLSSDITQNRLKIPNLLGDVKKDKEEKLYPYSIYYNKEDTVENLKNKIIQSDFRFQKVDIISRSELTTQKDINITTIQELIKNPFEIQINNYLKIKYFPSLNHIVNSPYPEENFNLVNSYNYFLLKNFLPKNNCPNTITKRDQLKTDILEKLNNLVLIYKTLEKEIIKSEEILYKIVDRKCKNIINLALLFFIVHLIAFYVLIYQLYGWDNIEPITYIVGNIYWVVALSYFVFKKKKLDLSLFSSFNFRENLIKKHSKLLNYNSIERDFVHKELNELNHFKEILNKI